MPHTCIATRRNGTPLLNRFAAAYEGVAARSVCFCMSSVRMASMLAQFSTVALPIVGASLPC